MLKINFDLDIQFIILFYSFAFDLRLSGKKMNERFRKKKDSIDTSIKEDEREFLLYKASHDLKAPLASIIGLTTIAKEEVTDTVALKYFGLIEKSSMKMDSTITDLVQYARIQKSKTENNEITFSKTLEQIISGLRYRNAAEKIKFTVNISQKKFTSDANLLASILQNLIDNSIKYKRQNVESFVKIDIKTDAEKAKIIIEDNGIGIEKDFQKKIFNMFFRASEQSSGSGLGLYIVKNAVNKLDGKISFTSQLNQGTTFIVIIPNSHKTVSANADN